MVLPALRVRVPNAANALLQAEQIKGNRAQNQLFQRQAAGQNALLAAFQENDFRTPEGRNAIVGQVGQAAPQMALGLQETFGRLSAQDQAKVAAEGRQVGRAIFGVRDQAGWTAARVSLGPLGQSLPEQYDPNVQRAVVQQAQSIDSLASDRRATLPTPPLSDARQDQELDQIAARGVAGSSPDNTLVQVVAPDGSLVFVPRSQAAGLTAAPPPSVSPNTQAQIDAANARNAGVSGNTAATIAAANARNAGVSGNTQAQIDAADARVRPPLPVNTVRLQEARDMAIRESRFADAEQLQNEIEAKGFGQTPEDASRLTPGATTETQKDLLNTQALLSRLDSIGLAFKPEYLTLEEQVGQGFNAFRERNLESFGILELSQEQKQSLAAFTVFKRDTFNNLSRFVQELSGVAVSVQEAERLAKSLPTIDQSPTEFKSTMNATIREANRAVARYNFALNTGIDPLDTGISMNGIDVIMAREEARLRRTLGAQLPAGQVETEVERELRALFGL